MSRIDRYLAAEEAKTRLALSRAGRGASRAAGDGLGIAEWIRRRPIASLVAAAALGFTFWRVAVRPRAVGRALRKMVRIGFRTGTALAALGSRPR